MYFMIFKNIRVQSKDIIFYCFITLACKMIGSQGLCDNSHHFKEQRYRYLFMDTYLQFIFNGINAQ